MATKKTNTGTIQTAQIEQIVTKIVESRLKETIEEFARTNESRVKEMALLERIVRVEEELKLLREMFEIRFEAFEKRFEAFEKRFEAFDKRFEVIDGRHESLQREMIARFETVDKRFESLQREMNARFESLQREMNARFEAMDKRFTMVQWFIGILVGIPSITFTIIQLAKII